MVIFMPEGGNLFPEEGTKADKIGGSAQGGGCCHMMII